MPFETRIVQQAYKFALDPTPRQARAFASHAGGARFAYNWGNERIIEALAARDKEKADTGEAKTEVPAHFDLCTAWTAWKNEHADDPDPEEGERRTNTAWVANNFSGTYQAALRDAAKAWSDYFKSASGERAGRRLGRPKFKKRGRVRESFQVHGSTLRMADAKHVVLPKIGTVTVMSDDSLHPAMARSRSRARPGHSRHMGNRRRARQAWRHLQRAQKQAAEAARLLAAASSGTDPEQTVRALNRLAGARARAKAVPTTAERLERARNALAEAKSATPEQRARLAKRVAKAEQALAAAHARTASRTDSWTERKLQVVQQAGALSPQQAADLADVYELAGERRAALAAAAQQARMVSATISRGADGLWWISLAMEVPLEVPTRPSRRQRAGGTLGVDFGVREIATCSNGAKIDNPRFLDDALTELKAAQRALSRCAPDSKRRAKAKERVGLIHADAARLREAALHRATTDLLRRHDVIGVEGWDVQQAMRDGSKAAPRRVRRDRNRAIADTGIGMARQMLRYKAERVAATVMVTDPHAKTGRTCSVCRRPRTTALPPHHELFTSDQCGHVLDRRLNTARALAGWAAQENKRGPSSDGPPEPRGGGVRPPAGPTAGGGQSPVKRAASTRPRRGETGTPGP